MARSRKTKTSGTSRIATRSKHPNKKGASATSSRHYPPPDFDSPSYTLHDAARNSEHSKTSWSVPGLSLRHRSMRFVSSNEVLDPNNKRIYSPSESINANVPANYLMDGPINHSVDSESECHERTLSFSSLRDPNVSQDMSIKVLQSPVVGSAHHSPSTSVSSNEVVFVGRNNLGLQQEYDSNNTEGTSIAKTLQPRLSPYVKTVSSDVIGGYPFENALWSEKVSNNLNNSPRGEDFDVQEKCTSATEELQQTLQRRARQMSAASSSNGSLKDVLDDYVDNMRANGEIEDAPQMNLIGALLNDRKNGWASSDIEDFDNMSTSDETVDIVKTVLSKRHRSGDLQYLVVGESQTVDDAKWIPRSALTMPSAVEMIKAFEEEEKHATEYQQTASDSEEAILETMWSTDSEPSLGNNEDDDFKDEKDLIERRMARMTDEHIARLFQKQESLGLNSEELQIFDGDEDYELSEDPMSHHSRALSRKKRDQKRRKRQPEVIFDVDEDIGFAGDDYGDFDIMDHERPSISRIKAPQSDPFLLDLSDSSLALNLRDTWAADRRRKRLRKQEREDLRAQGLLGKRNKFKPDLRAKYDNGMSLEQIEQEIEKFLFNQQQDNLSLPPMAKQERKVIHDIANAFGLKSKSQGSSKKRFPVLYKTKRTVAFDDDIFERLRTQLQRRFLPTTDQRGGGMIAKSRRGGIAGRGPGDIGYRDGEVVGAAAPELGEDNRGRAMLEKMGWSTGTALGALNNQGILTPIVHVVKNSKAGLG